MDPLTAFLVAILMMLLNGGVLGLMHRDLPAELRSAAVSWRIGTLLQAGGCILLALQALKPPGFVLPLGNAVVLLGVVLYWQALSQFYGHELPWPLMALPVLLQLPGLYWFANIEPDLRARIVIATLTWALPLLGSIALLARAPASDAAVSRRVLAGIFGGVLAFLLLRMVYFLQNGGPVPSLLDREHWINLVTPLIASVMPVIGTTAFLQLCSERIRRQWEHAASTDHLTGLPNRRILAEQGAERLALSRRRGDALAALVIDIDHFKQINDRHGHEVGDAALRHVAGVIAASCRAEDLAVRQGGEEFVALMGQLDAAAASAAAERIRSAVETAPLALPEGPQRLTVSIGLALLAAADRHLDDVLRRADTALYRAKAEGRNRSSFEAA